MKIDGTILRSIEESIIFLFLSLDVVGTKLLLEFLQKEYYLW